MKSFLKAICIGAILVALYIPLTVKLQEQRKLFLDTDFIAYTLPSTLIAPLSLEFKGVTADFLLFKFMTFIGGRIQELPNFTDLHWDYLEDTLDIITDLDPYYFDAYQYSQIFLAWDAGRPESANRLLEKAMENVPDNYRFPYYIGFNYYYFIKDNQKASEYFMKASKLPDSPYWLASWAARLSVFSFEHRAGIMFLEDMISQTRDERIKKYFQKRLTALQILSYLENKVDAYKEQYGKMPASLDDLVSSGIIKEIPEDPYGGKFILLSNGRVYTTSKMLEQQ
ncbi:MAG: hypothetical protein KQH63_14320 [Desulfobulbaceae bacterium]|nr:hypothetical protein [Desulfobulbaceae bacterium]